MIVASGAADSQGHERAGYRVKLFVDDVHLHLDRVVFREHFGAEREETGRGPSFESGCQILGLWQQIASQLFAHKLIVGLVFVEGLNDVVAILESVSVDQIFIQTVRVRVTGDIQPVTSPTLAVARRSEQTIHYARDRLRVRVIQEGLDFFGRWGKAGQIES